MQRRQEPRAAEFLQTRGHATSIIAMESLQLSQSGAAKARLWQPSPFLVEAMGRIALEQNQGIRKNLRALDVACGSGRDAVWLALEGYEVEAIDLLPDALQRAGDLARRSGVQMRLTVQDLERTPTLPERHYDIICVFRYLQRSLFPALQKRARPRRIHGLRNIPRIQPADRPEADQSPAPPQNRRTRPRNSPISKSSIAQDAVETKAVSSPTSLPAKADNHGGTEQARWTSFTILR